MPLAALSFRDVWAAGSDLRGVRGGWFGKPHRISSVLCRHTRGGCIAYQILRRRYGRDAFRACERGARAWRRQRRVFADGVTGSSLVRRYCVWMQCLQGARRGG